MQWTSVNQIWVVPGKLIWRFHCLIHPNDLTLLNQISIFSNTKAFVFWQACLRNEKLYICISTVWVLITFYKMKYNLICSNYLMGLFYLCAKLSPGGDLFWPGSVDSPSTSAPSLYKFLTIEMMLYLTLMAVSWHCFSLWLLLMTKTNINASKFIVTADLNTHWCQELFGMEYPDTGGFTVFSLYCHVHSPARKQGNRINRIYRWHQEIDEHPDKTPTKNEGSMWT